VVRESLGRCAAGACGRTTVRQVVVGWTRLQRDGVGSGAACHELVRDSKWTPDSVFLYQYAAKCNEEANELAGSAN
jgi:hypothetical protein